MDEDQDYIEYSDLAWIWLFDLIIVLYRETPSNIFSINYLNFYSLFQIISSIK